MRHLVFACLFGLVVGLIAAASRPTTPPATAQGSAPLAEFDAACASDNPYFVTTSFAMGSRTNEPALVAFHDTPDDSDQHILARYNQVGSTYGLAYDSRHRQVYVAAYHKRGTPYGPGGPGTIYRMDLAAGTVAPWVEVPDAGTDLHDDTENYIPDRLARDHAGKTSLGDIDLDEAGETLFVVNLKTRRILRYRVSDGSLIGSFDHGAAYQSWAGGEARPFGLKVWQGKLYHAVVRDASRSRRSADLMAYVYESDLDGKNLRTVLSLKLDYFRGYVPPRIEVNWLPWRDGTDSVAPNGTHDHAYIYPMPMLADLEFSDAGDMILGFRDRIGDMSLYDRNRNLPRGERSGHPFGDIVLARREGATWAAEPWPEFFNEDAGQGMNATGGFHIDTGAGGLARLTQSHTVINTAISPFAAHSGGAIWFNLDTGGDRRRETLYVGNAGRTNFGKANGLGDLELLCGETLATPTPTSTATPTATDTPTDTATPTATATVTATPTATATPTVTPTPTPAVIYLPMAEKSKLCLSDAYRTDVVLVLDRSTSMLRSVEPGGMAKNEAAIAAAKAFIDFLDFTPDDKNRFDQVAVVGFNDNAWIELGLTNDRMAALDALERIRTKTIEGTRLDLAFEWGQKPLDTSARKPENRPVLIMLTDGLPNRVPFGAGTAYPGSQRQEDTVIAAVDAVKAKGTRVYTIGLGTPRDILPWLMIASASDRDMYYFAPRPEDLAGIYERIAQTFNECNPKPPPKRCVPEELHADVVLVLDMSTSMYRETRGGRTKHEAAIEAAHQFVADLDLDRDGWGRQDQVAIVGFNGSSWTAIGLGDDRAAIDRAIDGLSGRIAEGTRIDLGLAEGQRVYEIGERLQPNTPVMILMTDGLPNQVPFGPGSPYPQCDRQECSVLAVAGAVKAKGTRVYAIGLGESSDVLRTLLESTASEPGMYYFAPDGEDLAAIYRQIAGRLQTCEP